MTELERIRAEYTRIEQYEGPDGWGALQGSVDWRIEERLLEQEQEYTEFLRRKDHRHEPCGFSAGEIHEKLFPFQRDIVRWALKRGRSAIFADCGMGKGLMALEWAKHVTAHTGKPTLIFAPLAVAQQFKREASKLGYSDIVTVCESDTDVRSGINVTNYEKMYHFTPDQFGGVVCDECFPPDTVIDTSLGPCYIKDIREGDKILNASGVDTVSDVHRRPVQYAIKVQIRNRSIISSPNHPYFTQRGWVCAQDLQPGDRVMETAEAVRLVRGGSYSNRIGAGTEEVLRQVLLSEMAYASAVVSGEGSQRERVSEERGIASKVVCVGVPSGGVSEGKDTQSEPYVSARDSREGLPHIESHEAQTFRTWWQWKRTDCSTVNNAQGFGRSMGDGVQLIIGEKGTRFSNLLQARLSESRSKNRHRGGWAISSLDSQEITGQEKGCEVGYARVESIAVLEQGHPDLERYRDADGNVYFYDIGGTRHPSFSIDGLLVHNSSIIKSQDGKTRKALMDFCDGINYRLACTATPSPNDYMELGSHAEFLGVMRHVEMLALFFVHDGGETSKWRLKGHAETAFWKWVCSWAVAIRKPSDLGYSDDGFVLPPLRIHQITVQAERPVDGYLFAVEAKTMDERRKARKDSITGRVEECANLAIKSDDQWLIWCNLNAESESVTKAISDAVEVTGSDESHVKESRLMGFINGDHRVLVTKPLIAGFGLNLQCCNKVAFLGLSDSYEQLYQAIRRCWRFGQTNPVDVYIITAETEGAVVRNIERKEKQAMEMMEEMVKHMKDEMQREVRGLVRETSEYQKETATSKDGKRWIYHLGDCVEMFTAMPTASVDFSIFSPPFASLYTYSNSDRDMGNSTDEQFWKHFQFLIPQLYRVLRPGRLLSFHCMNLPSTKERDGYIGIKDFRGDLIRAFQKAGFIYHSEVTIWKDPVTAMQRTKAIGLLYKQLRKDSALSRQGIPDYLVTMRKPEPNPVPITKTHEGFPVDRWQRYASPVWEFGDQNDPPKLFDFIDPSVYAALSDAGKMEVMRQVVSHSERVILSAKPDPVWMDINPSDTLQRESAREEDDERHICPLQLQVIERAIELWTNPDEVVASPFGGIASEGYVALKMGRRFIGTELKRSYWEQGVRNLKVAEQGAQSSLFAGLEETA